MTKPADRPKDDPSSAPESGTNRDDTSGNLPAGGGNRPERGESNGNASAREKDDPSEAGEER